MRDYSEYNTDDDYNAGIQKLNTEMLSGKLPDMIDINTYSMPVEQYAAKGFLTDLYELIDADPELRRESFVQPVSTSSPTPMTGRTPPTRKTTRRRTS